MVLRLLLIALASAVISRAGVQAQIVADPHAPGSQRPTVLRAANGVPLVNVQTPSVAGVSRNTYRQFDVDPQGVILNNSRTDTSSELGGWIQGNPWLARGPARILLNEINSGDPSRLAGRLEVAGTRAEVIVANPSGILCSGCGFINASRATLTTGTPVMSEGALTSFRVLGGSLSVDGKGLDVSGTDYAVLLARSAQINAKVHAKHLAVVTGAAETTATGSLDSAGAITPISGPLPAPRVLLDVSALGSVYAGKIFLVGTEAGLGVVQAGRLVADDELTLSTQGWLTQSGRLQAGNALRVTASSVDNTRGTLAGADVAIDAPRGSVLNDAGVIAATQRLRMESASVHNSGGRIISDGGIRIRTSDFSNTGGLVNTSGDVDLEAATFSNRNTQARDLGVQARNVWIRAQSVESDAGLILADDDLWVATGSTLTHGAGLMMAGRRLQIDAGDLSVGRGGRLVSDGTVRIAVERDFLNRGLVDGADVRIDAKTVSNQGAGRLFGDRLSIGADTLTNDTETITGVRDDAVIAARERLDIGARELINREHALIFSGGTAPDALSIGGALDAQGRATGSAEHVVNRSATIESLGGLRLNAQRLENTNAHFSTQIVETLAPTSRRYIQPQGGVMLPAELFVWEDWSRAGRYRFRTDPSVGSGAVLGQSPIPRVGEQTCSGEDDQSVCTRVPGADYPAAHAAWAYFAKPAPDPEPAPPTLREPVPPAADRAGTCSAGPAQDAVACQAYTDELSASRLAHATYTQVWTDYQVRRSAWQAQTDDRYAQLDDRIEAYNASFSGRYIQNWTQYTVTRTERETRVLSSDPGRILSGGDMHLRGGDLVNDKSQIVAGGALTGDLSQLRTVEAEGVRIVSESGTSQYTASRWRGGGKRYHQR
ncbi:MAG: putative hemagglutination domain, partial [Pseudomonadota bacterium]